MAWPSSNHRRRLLRPAGCWRASPPPWAPPLSLAQPSRSFPCGVPNQQQVASHPCPHSKAPSPCSFLSTLRTQQQNLPMGAASLFLLCPSPGSNNSSKWVAMALATSPHGATPCSDPAAEYSWLSSPRAGNDSSCPPWDGICYNRDHGLNHKSECDAVLHGVSSTRHQLVPASTSPFLKPSVLEISQMATTSTADGDELKDDHFYGGRR
ncbi:hypothetical protein U9M48_001624 [Paspalum notatum var. saurae]|uniref:Uncharacterized protein n=1 Tax=Paspalum notatum var. saurae TaxID=547442 RepID=A0AAQ3PIK7_PASNO